MLAQWPVVLGRSRLLQRALETLLPLASCGVRVSRSSAAERMQGRHVGLVPLPLPRPAFLVPVLNRALVPGVAGAGCWGTSSNVGAYAKVRAARPGSFAALGQSAALRT